MQIGIIGCGEVSSKYLEVLRNARHIHLKACADRDSDRAKTTSTKFDISRVLSPDELIHAPEVDLVLNLTPPSVHSEIGLAALRAGKHYYTEKPLATDRAAAQEMVRLAERHGLLIGSAPDTFLGSAHQTGRRIIEGGSIGVPVAIEATFVSPGYETSRPLARKYYSGPGSGPLFSPGLYFVSSLISLFGSINLVYGISRRTAMSRMIQIGPETGSLVPVEVDTHFVSILQFESGPTATFTASFDIGTSASSITVHGTGGKLTLPDPRTYAGEVTVKYANSKRANSIESGSTANDLYGAGLLDMIKAAGDGHSYRTSAQFTYHTLDVVQAIIESSSSGAPVPVLSRCARPSPLEE